MLDRDHPQAEYIFDAMGIQSKIKGILFAAVEAGHDRFSAAELTELNGYFLQLKTLNIEHFQHNLAIERELDHLQALFKQSHNLADLFAHLVKFTDAPGDNFGTWAI